VPCIQEFPRTVELHKTYSGQGLQVVSVSVDDPSQRGPVLEVLRRQGAAFENLICEAGSSETTFQAFGIPGPVPFYQLYDRDGKLRFRFSPVPSDFENTEPMGLIESRVRQLLAEP
jgi:hypothetical protein